MDKEMQSHAQTLLQMQKGASFVHSDFSCHMGQDHFNLQD